MAHAPFELDSGEIIAQRKYMEISGVILDSFMSMNIFLGINLGEYDCWDWHA